MGHQSCWWIDSWVCGVPLTIHSCWPFNPVHVEHQYMAYWYIYICMAINVNIVGVHLTMHSCCFCLNIYIYIYYIYIFIQQKAYFSCFRSPFTGELLWLATDAVLQQEHFFWIRSSWRRQWRRSFTSWRSGESEETHRETRIKPYKNTISGWWFQNFLFSIIYGIILPIDFHNSHCQVWCPVTLW